MRTIAIGIIFFHFISCSGMIIYPNRIKSVENLKGIKCGSYKYIISTNSDIRIGRDSFGIMNDGIFSAIDECNLSNSQKEVLVTIQIGDTKGENRSDGRTLSSLPFAISSASVLPIASDVYLSIKFHDTDSQRKASYEYTVITVFNPLFLFFKLDYDYNKRNVRANFYEPLKIAILNFESMQKNYEK